MASYKKSKNIKPVARNTKQAAKSFWNTSRFLRRVKLILLWIAILFVIVILALQVMISFAHLQSHTH